MIEENDEEYVKFFGAVYELKDEISIENCLKIFDEKQAKVNQYMQQLRGKNEIDNEIST